MTGLYVTADFLLASVAWLQEFVLAAEVEELDLHTMVSGLGLARGDSNMEAYDPIFEFLSRVPSTETASILCGDWNLRHSGQSCLELSCMAATAQRSSVRSAFGPAAYEQQRAEKASLSTRRLAFQHRPYWTLTLAGSRHKALKPSAQDFSQPQLGGFGEHAQTWTLIGFERFAAIVGNVLLGAHGSLDQL